MTAEQITALATGTTALVVAAGFVSQTLRHRRDDRERLSADPVPSGTYVESGQEITTIYLIIENRGQYRAKDVVYLLTTGTVKRPKRLAAEPRASRMSQVDAGREWRAEIEQSLLDDWGDVHLYIEWTDGLGRHRDTVRLEERGLKKPYVSQL